MIEGEIYHQGRRLKIKMPVLKLFAEAHRRRGIGGDDSAKPIAEAWVGLGAPSTYRPGIVAGYFRPHNDCETSRVLNWYLFTQAGIDAYTALYGAAARVQGYRGLPKDGGSEFELSRAI